MTDATSGDDDLQFAETLLQRALIGAKAAFGPTHAETALATSAVGDLGLRGRGAAAAAPMYRRARDLYKARPARETLEAAEAVAEVAASLELRGDDCDALRRHALELSELVGGKRSSAYANAIEGLADSRETFGLTARERATGRSPSRPPPAGPDPSFAKPRTPVVCGPPPTFITN